MNTPTVRGTLYYRPGRTPGRPAVLPMAALREHHPDPYRRHAAKDQHDPSILDQPVPALTHLGSRHLPLPDPSRPLFDALAWAGRSVRSQEPWNLNANLLYPDRTVIHLMRHGRDGHHPDPPDEHDWLPFTTASLRAVSRATVDAIHRLENLGPGDPWLPWVDVPHVLHRGELSFNWFS